MENEAQLKNNRVHPHRLEAQLAQHHCGMKQWQRCVSIRKYSGRKTEQLCWSADTMSSTNTWICLQQQLSLISHHHGYSMVNSVGNTSLEIHFNVLINKLCVLLYRLNTLCFPSTDSSFSYNRKLSFSCYDENSHKSLLHQTLRTTNRLETWEKGGISFRNLFLLC